MRIRGLLVALALLSGCAHHAAPAELAQQPAAAVAVGAKAPDAQLVRASGEKLALAEAVHQHAQTIVVFYRGFW